MTEPTPQLTEEAVREIEARADAASPRYVVDWSKGEHALLQANGWRPAGDEQPRTIATFDKDDGYLDLLFCAEARVDIPALIRDWRAMQAENRQLRTSFEISEANRTSDNQCHRDLMRTKEAENAALRAQVTKFSELADKRHDELCEARRQRDSLAADMVTHIRDATAALREQLAEVEKERDAANQEIDAAWLAIHRGWEIESREYFQREAPHNGFGSPLAQAVHHMWKRKIKDGDTE